MRRVRAICSRFRSFGMAPGFAPNQIPGFTTSFVPAASLAAGKLWQDLGETIPANQHNDPVRVLQCPWSGIKWTAPSDAARGLLKIVGGKVWIETDGADDCYRSSVTNALLPTNGGDTSHCIAFRPGTDANAALVEIGNYNLYTPNFHNNSLAIQSKRLVWNNYDGQEHRATDTVDLSTGQWYEAIGMRANGANRLYQAGILRSTVASGNANVNSASLLGLAANSIGGDNFAGSISAAVFYSRELTDQEISAVSLWLASTH